MYQKSHLDCCGCSTSSSSDGGHTDERTSYRIDTVCIKSTVPANHQPDDHDVLAEGYGCVWSFQRRSPSRG